MKKNKALPTDTKPHSREATSLRAQSGSSPTGSAPPGRPSLCRCSLEQSAFMFKSIYETEMSASHGHLIRKVALHVTFSGVRVLLFHLLVNPMCPVDKGEDGDTNSYRNKPSLGSGNPAVLSITADSGGPLAEALTSDHSGSGDAAGPQAT